MITETELNSAIEKFAKKITKQNLVQVEHKVDYLSKPTNCISNVLMFIEKNNGKIEYGWTFNHRVSPEFGNYLFATHHAIWKNKDGNLIDITPFHEKEKHRPITVLDKVLFLPDVKAKPFRIEQYIIPLPLEFYGINKTEKLRNYLKHLREKEIHHYYENYKIKIDK